MDLIRGNGMGHRILVLSASVGAGHLRAAEAVEAALKEMVPDASVQNLDVLDMTNRLFRHFYARSYLDLVNKAPHVLGYFYDLLDQPSKSGKNHSDRLRQALQRLNLGKFIKFMKSRAVGPGDQYAFSAGRDHRRAARPRDLIKVPQVTVTTDFETHRLWVNQPCERYFTATEEGAAVFAALGRAGRSDIMVTGIPIHPVFS